MTQDFRSVAPIADLLSVDAPGLAALIHEHDWAATPLGDSASWSESLSAAVRIVLTSRFAMWMGWGEDMTFLYNDAYAPTLGVKHPWALGKPAREVWSEVWSEAGPRIAHVMRTGTATWDEGLLLLLERSGYPEETYHTFSYSPLSDDDGRVAGMLCVVVEETDRVIGERRLATMRELSSALGSARSEAEVLSAAAATLERNTTDLPFTLVYLVDAESGEAKLSATTGFVGSHPAAVPRFTLDDGDAPWPIARALEAGGPHVVENVATVFADLPAGAWNRAPDRAVIVPIVARGGGRAGVFIAGLNPYRRFDGAYAGFLELVSGQLAASLANAHAFEEEQKRAEALAALDQAKTVFFSNVSHEFRTPLTLVLAPLEEALRREPPPDTRTDLELAHRNALRLTRLVNSLLDFSRLEAGRVRAAYVATDLGAYTAELVSSFRSACDRAGLALTIELAPMPEPVYVDREMWEKIILNLISNAFKHTFVGGITVRVRADGDQAEVVVADTGVGIPASQRSSIFERFHRVPNARSRTHEGTGIGLALVLELVRLHGGTITVASVEDRGSTFIVRVPFGTAHLPGDRVAAAGETRPAALGAAPFVDEALRWLPDDRSHEPAATTRAAPQDEADADLPAAPDTPRVLLADDNADMRGYIARLLRSQGWHVDAVSDGRVALEHARAYRPDLLLTDVMMPGLDGFALVREFRQDPSTATLPILLVSARAGDEARVEGLQSGADDYLVKPFAARELIARVAAHLSLGRLRREAEQAQAEEAQLIATLQRVGAAVTAELDRETLVQLVTDEATQITGAQFGAFFYNMYDDAGEASTLYSVSGVPREVFSRFPMPRDTAVFAPTFRGSSVVRSDDITKDPRYGKNAPHSGIPDGHLPVVSYLAAPVVARSGEVLGGLFFGHGEPARFTRRHERLIVGIASWAAVAIDKSHLYEAEKKARREAVVAREEAERANRAKTEFLAMMSHELRTPLNAIAGHLQLVEMGIHGPLTKEQRVALDRIDRSQRHLLRLINDVLNLTRIEAGRLEYAIEPIDVANLVDELHPLIDPQFSAKNIHYRVENPSESIVVCADREKLGQILLNLLSNAGKFTPPGGRIVVRSVADAEAEQARISVSDTGIGIPAEKLERVFEPFVQVDRSHSQPKEGAGLGLAISRDLARGMAGDLTAESVEGGGSTFTLRLPLAPRSSP